MRCMITVSAAGTRDGSARSILTAPWGGLSEACECGGAGEPCPDCNVVSGDERPAMPADFVPTVDKDNGPIQ